MFIFLSVRKGGEATVVSKAVEEAVIARVGEGREEQRVAAAAGANFLYSICKSRSSHRPP